MHSILFSLDRHDNLPDILCEVLVCYLTSIALPHGEEIIGDSHQFSLEVLEMTLEADLLLIKFVDIAAQSIHKLQVRKLGKYLINLVQVALLFAH